MKTLKIICLFGFLALVAAKYFNLFSDFNISGSFSLFDVRYIFLVVYFLISLYEFIQRKKA